MNILIEFESRLPPSSISTFSQSERSTSLCITLTTNYQLSMRFMLMYLKAREFYNTHLKYSYLKTALAFWTDTSRNRWRNQQLEATRWWPLKKRIWDFYVLELISLKCLLVQTFTYVMNGTRMWVPFMQSLQDS